MQKLSLIALVASAVAVKINDDAKAPPRGDSGEGLGSLEAEIGGPMAAAIEAAPVKKAAPVVEEGGLAAAVEA